MLRTTDDNIGRFDVYEIGRANRPDMYNLFYRKPTPLVRRGHIYELQERLLYDGQVFDRTRLQPGDTFEGPAIIEELSCWLANGLIPLL